MKILLFGKNGQVGWELQRSLAPLGELIALDRQGAGHTGDLSDLDGLRATVAAYRPDVIVNAAAYTAVDQAEAETDQARLINAIAPGVLAEEAEKVGAWLVHYSTDYVFDGSGSRPWQEADATQPLNCYGRTKAEGEQRIAEHCSRHLIFRTSWVYAARGNNFAKTMLRLASQRESFNVIDDQWGAPTGAELIADVTAHALRHACQKPEAAGTYHLAATGFTNWHAYGQHVIETARKATPDAAACVVREIVPVSTERYTSMVPTPAERPRNSRLDTRKLESTFGLQMPAWQDGVNRMLAEIPTTFPTKVPA
ncbi:MAG: dTDP-4-dehydrorhamnose reductase [Pseudomonadota bacterium]